MASTTQSNDGTNDSETDQGARTRRLLTSSEVAALFGVDRKTVTVWAKRGRLPAIRTPGGQHRFPADEIQRILREAGASPAQPA